jgi:hypothetical protein
MCHDLRKTHDSLLALVARRVAKVLPPDPQIHHDLVNLRAMNLRPLIVEYQRPYLDTFSWRLSSTHMHIEERAMRHAQTRMRLRIRLLEHYRLGRRLAA